jgi:SAM-dependent methyltransferase
MNRYRAIAEYYDHETERIEWLKRDVPFFLKKIGKRPRDVLELAVGTARAAIPISQAGHRVVGIDYAPDMLAIARRKRDAVGLRDAQLQLHRRDVLRMDLKRTFDWVCIFFNTFLGFTTLAQQDRVLQVARKHLRPKGRLWIDIFQPNLALLADPESLNRDASIFHVPRYDRTVYMTVDIKRDQAKQLQTVTFNYKWFDKHGVAHRQRTRFDITFMFPRELRILLERNGFRLMKLWGNYDGSPVNVNSPRMISLAAPR